MAKIKISTDSTADIPKSFCEELNISGLPLTILAGEKVYRDGQTITVEITWGAVPADQQTQQDSQSAQNNNNSQDRNGYSDPFDMFNRFFGNRYGN